MSIQEKFEKIQSDFSNLDMENIGGWPLPVKIVCWVAVMAAVIVLTYQGVLRDQKAVLDTETKKEATLRAEFEVKVQDAANLDAYRNQMKEMSDSFSTLLGQLPKDTEVPGLLDDISEKGQSSGLNFNAIDLKQEKKADFYVELPISISVTGGYHDFGAFVSGVAGLPRIVTLHDFLIVSSSAAGKKGGAAAAEKVPDNQKESDRPRGSEELTMTIMAKTYRYKSAEDADKEIEKTAEKKNTKPQPAKAAAGEKGKGGVK